MLCRGCDQEVTSDNSYKEQKRLCKACYIKRGIEWDRTHPDAVRNRRYRYLFGITLDVYNSVLAAQDGVCAICKAINLNGRRLSVDHDHRTGAVRGLLCHNCNSAVGHLKDNPLLIEAAAQYLREHDTQIKAEKEEKK